MSSGIPGERNYGIELLRPVLMWMVCLLHVLGQGGVLSACAPGTAAYGVFWFLEAFCYCAVDGFALITGYTSSGRPRKVSRLAELWFQVLFYSLAVTAILTAAGLDPAPTVFGFVRGALPVTYRCYWYFSAYVLLFFLIPVLDRFLFALEETKAKIFLFLLIVLFCGVGLPADAFRLEGGYSSLWLIALYCIGVLAKKVRLWERRHGSLLALGCLLCAGVTWAVKVFWGSDLLLSYTSPTVLFSALTLVCLFARFRRTPKGVRVVSRFAFGIYLFQLNAVVWGLLNGAFRSAAEAGLFPGILYVLGGSLGLFFIGWIVDALRFGLARLLRVSAWCDFLARKGGALTARIFGKSEKEKNV